MLLRFFLGVEAFAVLVLRFCGRPFAAVVFRRAPVVLAVARPLEFAFFRAEVAFRPRALLRVADFLVLFFFAILMPLKMVSGFDRWP